MSHVSPPSAAARPSPARTPAHRVLLDGEWWRERLPAFRGVDEATFLDARWQMRSGATSVDQLLELVGPVVGEGVAADIRAGFDAAPMAVRLSPYVLALIDWTDVADDPIRRQFVPLGSEREPDHPLCALDSLGEQQDAVVPGLTHRYPDKVLFLALDICPVYCRFCTRSYAIGTDTAAVDKVGFGPSRARWEEAFRYIAEHPAVEDVVVSGGDAWMLAAPMLEHIGNRLLDIPNVRRIRFATKGLAVLPMKLLTDPPWLDALTRVADRGRKQGVHVCVHTHVNHPSEITAITARAADTLFQRGIVVRNQGVVQAGVNDDADTLVQLVRRLAFINVRPYYLYAHDVVPGVEANRTTLGAVQELEKEVRGNVAGFDTPTFVCDVMGGGGKRVVHAAEHYDPETGIAVFRSPVVSRERPFLYVDPLRALAPRVRTAWADPARRTRMVESAIRKAGLEWS